MKRTVLITGSTGLVGGYFLFSLLKQGKCRIHLLVREGRKTPQERLEHLCDYFGMDRSHASSVTFHCGDISKPGLGLADDEISELKESLTDIFHAAAHVSFDDDAKKSTTTTNLNGAQHLTALCGKETRFFHLSTAYVAGLHEKRFYEDELDVGQDFRNDYEKSKFLAEKMLHSFFSDRPELLTVLRPSIITGEYESGKTYQFYTLYKILNMMSLFGRRYGGNEFKIVYNPESTQNYIPVDRLNEMICEVFHSPHLFGKTFHLVNSSPIQNKDMKPLLEKALNLKIRNAQPGESSHPFNRTAVVKGGAYLNYLRGEPEFDCVNRNLLAAAQKPMGFDEQYLENLLAFCNTSNWGKALEFCR